MAKRSVFLLALFSIVLLTFYVILLRPVTNGTKINILPPEQIKTILLVPLDSRPPCNQFVIDAAKIDNLKIITPPTELLDYYYQAGNTSALADWLSKNFKGIDAAVISIDQLLHGGLIASREGTKSAADSEKIIALLTKLHKENPNIPIYAFNILPRITPPPSIGGYSLWKDFIEYSRLVDRSALYNTPADASRLNELKNELPEQDLRRYHAVFDNNAQMNRSLSLLVKNGTLKMLVIGQDDGENFGLPNLKKRELLSFLKSEAITPDKVFITHGADEIALSLIAKISADRHHYTPKIAVEYNDPSTPGFIMPFMAGSVSETVSEKLQLFNARQVHSAQDADFTFFVSCTDNLTLDTRKKTAQRINTLIQQQLPTALVDLSEHFLAEETVFPFLINCSIPINSLIAYAGWNTASNSIGTAISQAVIFSAAKKDTVEKNSLINIYTHNLSFLLNRFLEDYYFLKDIIDPVNFHLIKAGYTNVGDLDLEHNYRFANAMLQDSMTERAFLLKESTSFRKPVSVNSSSGKFQLQIKDFNINTCFPWPRTFEIFLQTELQLEELP